MYTIAVVATKGGVGKTTLAAHMGALFRDIGLNVLFVDADIQPSLSRFFRLKHQAPHGLTECVMRGFLTQESISQIDLPPLASKGAGPSIEPGKLDIVLSDTRNGRLQDWLSGRLDRLVRIKMAINQPEIQKTYDICIIDTQGAVGHLQDAAVHAAHVMVAPASPDTISAREFIDGTNRLLEHHESAANLGYQPPTTKAIINRTENTNDSRMMSDLIREQFLEMHGRLTVLDTTIPSIVAFRKAATQQVPVHWIDPDKAGDIMHHVMWELVPKLRGHYAPNHKNFGKSLDAEGAGQSDNDQA